MKNTKGFTLIELMVVVLIVAILAAVAIPLMRGRIDAAKWSEGKAGAGTIVTAIRSLVAEQGEAISTTSGLALQTDLGFGPGDLAGTYFNQSDYVVDSVSYNDATGVLTWQITINTSKTNAPAIPIGYTFIQTATVDAEFNAL